MAVYTHLDCDQVEDFMRLYDLGELRHFTGIAEGVENTNYKIETSAGEYILTIFEKRTPAADLPFFFSFMAHLNDKGIECPKVVADRQGRTIRNVGDKAAALISFLHGHNIKAADITDQYCFEMGQLTARLHLAANDFSQKRGNSVSLAAWRNIFAKIETKIDGEWRQLIASELEFLERNLHCDLPRGIVHADLFPDNVFVIGGKVDGVIDFYFSCEDYFVYDLALVVNSWCFNPIGEFQPSRFENLLNGYSLIRELNDNEKTHFQVMLRAAAIRIFLTRAHDWVFHDPAALVTPKNPQDYISILNYHRTHNVFS